MTTMFPHKVTRIAKSDYSVSVIKGVYWSGSISKGLSSKGVDKGNAVAVVLPLSKDVFSLGDMLIKGEIVLPTITSISQLESYDYVTVVSKQVNDVGSSIDNVVLTCQ